MPHPSLLSPSALITTTIILLSTCTHASPLTLHMSSSTAQEFQRITVINQGQIQHQFQSTIYDNPTVCSNGMLKLIEFNASKSQPELIWFEYEGVELRQIRMVSVNAAPNQEPKPQMFTITPKSFAIIANCAAIENLTNQNYYNHVKMTIETTQSSSQSTTYQFSFLLNCDRYNRHKKFQYGYLLIGFINAAITIGVAMHSRIWSIRFREKPLRILLTWKLFLLIMVVLIVVGITFYLLAAKEFKMANQIIKYLGLVVALIFTFICMNETLYLFRWFKTSILQLSFYNIRKCQLFSFLFAIIIFIISLFIENWVLYTFLACCICVGSIKMLYFSSMQQAFYSLAISVGSVTLIAVVLHYVLPRSYNDYASQLSSPLFIEVPDFVDNLFKKCSWLPVVDIIVPGVLLSFLRTYDNNFSTGWGGVYTVTGNVSFLLATTFWIGIQALYPFSVPFSLITYTILLVSICVIAFKRNELKTLWYGYFLQQNEIDMSLLKEETSKHSEGNHRLDEETMNAIRVRDSMSSSKGDDEEVREMVDDRVEEGAAGRVSRSEFRVKNQRKGSLEGTGKAAGNAGGAVYQSSLR